MKRIPALVGLFIPAVFFANADTLAPFTLDLAQLGGPSAVAGITIASGGNLNYGLASTPDGSILFGQTIPTSQFGLFYGDGPAIGSVWKSQKQTDGTFAAPTKLVDGLSGVVTDVRTLSDGTILVDSGAGGAGGPGTRRMSFFTPTGQAAGTLAFTYPNYGLAGWEHGTGMSYVSSNPDGTSTVYFIVGSKDDNIKTAATVSVSGMGLSGVTLNGDSVYRMTVSTGGGSVVVTNAPQQIATGLRNPFGLSFDSEGDLVVGNNGIDGAAPSGNETGADTIGIIPKDQIGTSIFDFGFPGSYASFAGPWVGPTAGIVQPTFIFSPDPDSHGVLQDSEGLSGMEYVAPGSLPFVGALGGEITTFHGVFNASGAANNHGAVQYCDFASEVCVPIVDAGLAGVGHLDSVLVVGHALYLADMSTGGDVNVVGQNFDAQIYEFDFSPSAPEPATWILCAGVLVWLAIRRSKTAIR